MTPAVYTLKASAYSSHTLLLKALPEDGEGRRVLDVGCGNGYLAALLAQRGYEVTGIERREGHSADFPESVKLIEADLECGLPPLPSNFDYILCADVLEHLRSPAKLLHDLKDVLSPGGLIIASLPNSGNVWFRLNVVLGRFPQDDKGLFDRTHLRFFMWKGWRDLFREAGLEFTGIHPTGIPVGLMMPQSLEHSPPVRLAESVCYGMARIWMKLFAYQFVVCARAAE